MGFFEEIFFGKTTDDYYQDGHKDAQEGNTGVMDEMLQSAFCFIPDSPEQAAYNAGVRDYHEEK